MPSPQSIAFSLTLPRSDSKITQDVCLDHPQHIGPFHTGIRLEHVWNADINAPIIAGDLSSELEFADPRSMQVGIDLVGAMDCNIDRPRITSAHIGIRAATHPEGFPRCEGLEVRDGWLMHVNTGIELHGSHLGGWPTPSVELHPRHVAFNRLGVRATAISFLNIHDTNFYASHYQRGQWAIYLVGCTHVQITNCDFWRNWPPGDPGFFGGIVLDACEDVEITGGTYVKDISIALWATSSCKRVRTNGKIWDKLITQGKVANYAQQTE